MAVRRIHENREVPLHRDHDPHPDDRRILHEQNMNRLEAEQRSLGALVSELAGEMSTLVRKEVELVKLEASEKASKAKSGAMSIAIGGALAFAGLIVLLMAGAFALGSFMHMGWAALIVGGAAALIGGIMAMAGSSALKPENLAPQRSAESLREDVEFAKGKANGKY